jgi:hypothetical protein
MRKRDVKQIANTQAKKSLLHNYFLDQSRTSPFRINPPSYKKALKKHKLIAGIITPQDPNRSELKNTEISEAISYTKTIARSIELICLSKIRQFTIVETYRSNTIHYLSQTLDS